MLKINETIVVEGKSDLSKIKQIVDANVIITNGSECSKTTIDLIKKANDNNGVILLFDPDYVGEQIRKKILYHIPNCKNAFINKEDVQKNKLNKIGVAEASNEAILFALKNYVSFNQKNKSISLFEFNKLNINSKQKRLFICNFLKISYCNNKQLLKRLQMIGISQKELHDILINYEN